MFHADIVVQPSLSPDGELTSKSATFSRNLRTLWQSPDRLPASIAQSPTAMRILDLIGPLHWGDLPERNLHRFYGQPTVSNAAFIAAQLIMLNEGPWDSNRLRRFLIEHPCFIPLLGFAPLAAVDLGTGFRPAPCLPTARHFTRMLRSLPNAVLQFLLADTVRLITDRLCSLGLPPIDCVSLDTKHIVAFVKEDNRKAFPMPLKTAFIDRSSTLVEHVRGRYVCPLRFMHLASPDAPERLPSRCPIRHARWKGGGCTVQMPTSIGARIRYTLDRDSELYKRIYAQRSADERINSQAVKLGIEHPELRNGAAIANRNTLIYILINLRFLQRLTHQPPATTQLETRDVCPA